MEEIKQKAIICDLDGVIFNVPKELQNNFNWADFYAKLSTFSTNDWAISLIKGLDSQGIKILFITARGVRCEQETRERLEKIFDFKIQLFMRQNEDLRDSYLVKKDYCEDLLQKYTILFAIDDEKENCEMFNKLGIKTLFVS